MHRIHDDIILHKQMHKHTNSFIIHKHHSGKQDKRSKSTLIQEGKEERA